MSNFLKDDNFSEHDLFPSCKSDNDFVGIAKCCLGKCNQSYKFCHDSCKNKGLDREKENSCINNCIIIKNLCKTYCQLSDTQLQINNNFYKCTGNYGCNYLDRADIDQPNQDSARPARECVEKNIKGIRECCTSNCPIDYSNNCDDYCDFFLNTPFEIENQIPFRN